MRYGDKRFGRHSLKMYGAGEANVFGINNDGWIRLSLYDLAARYIGVKEVAGQVDNPLIMAMLKLTPENGWSGWPSHDEVPWCSAAMNFWAWNLRLPRSKSLLARSWLAVGRPVTDRSKAKAKNDVVILKRGDGLQPGPENMTAPGHVGCFAGFDDNGSIVSVLGGNQNNQVSVAPYPARRILGIRRLYE